MDSSRSSLPYQIVISFSKRFLPCFVLVETLLFLFKVVTLPYPSGNIASEVCLLLFYSLIDYGRLMSGERGNLTERALFVCVSLVLSIPACTILVYWYLWQTYVLRLEAVLVILALTLQAIQVLLALVAMLSLSKSSS